jgi:FtsH-binding integral membrane protein
MAQDVSSNQPRVRRVVGLVITGLVIEVGLVVIVQLGPALRVIMHPVYVVVAALFAFAIWHASRRREERRHGDRRHGARPE